MSEVRFQVDEAFLKNLQDQLGTSKSTDVAREALTLLNWAVKEKSEGREVASVVGGNIYSTVAMPSLDKVSKS